MRPKRRGGNRRLLSLKVARNIRHRMDGIELLSELPDRCVSMAFFDPQYRTVLDKQNYGNEGERQIERAKLRQQSDDEIAFFCEEINRVLEASGHLMLWIDKFGLAEGTFRKWIRRTKSLQVVDVIAWNKLRPGMGRRARCVTEYLVVLQKVPTRAKGVWIDHSIRDCWSEMSDRAIHAHAKPYVLTERLIRAATKRGALVLDPCAGGYGVLDACLASGRDFIGCDITTPAEE